MEYCSQTITASITACQPGQFSASLDRSKRIQECYCFAWQKLLIMSVPKPGRKMLPVHLSVRGSTASHILDPRENFFCTQLSSVYKLLLE